MTGDNWYTERILCYDQRRYCRDKIREVHM